jgi:hypothetical protein
MNLQEPLAIDFAKSYKQDKPQQVDQYKIMQNDIQSLQDKIKGLEHKLGKPVGSE